VYYISSEDITHPLLKEKFMIYLLMNVRDIIAVSKISKMNIVVGL
jgi:hypothetical protein